MAMLEFSKMLGDARRVLVAGCGGGYDVLGAVPLRHALRAAGIEVHLASLSFAYLNGLTNAVQDAAVPNLYAVGANAATTRAYCPEAHLAKFFDAEDGGAHVVWSFDKTGVRPLAAAYRALVDRLHIDAIVLVDGGIDAVLRGDETSLGTPSEDLATLAAATSLGIPVLLACIGMTAELRDGIAHAQVFERIAELSREGAYLGASALVPGTPACDVYVRAVEAVFAGQSEQKQSHVHRVITRAVRGEFGATAPYVWLSPLASVFWFFDARVVARTHCFLDELRATDSIWDVAARIEAIRKTLSIKERSTIPI
ncbi:MAG TPA: DUF1152 domain-containing protein [Kofleriaceae bacterium]|nr:DUF1152 domain-containing protein [Kofleriaceae bacterium]